MKNTAFERRELVRFGHCDPAGIVFYPRYFEMLNALVEDWFTDGLGIDYAQLLGARRTGMPSVRLAADFRRISRMGDWLSQRIRIEKLGRTSLGLAIAFECEDGLRVAFEQVLVCTSLDTHAAQPFPDDLRAALERALGEQE
ncbi:acyl-CoA thioesterase [Roseateles violae]|uniref:Thioesterase family protein n=1 Tax=Roseateles violae TaxID=3058042 RepID=A0ABT8DUL1_9BURK|nr:thioesterase family protein [Pelomonas sp. PFR6]MDN3921970.1 thioesterase family protein [Pelomonas sp. PFR6]